MSFVFGSHCVIDTFVIVHPPREVLSFVITLVQQAKLRPLLLPRLNLMKSRFEITRLKVGISVKQLRHYIFLLSYFWFLFFILLLCSWVFFLFAFCIIVLFIRSREVIDAPDIFLLVLEKICQKVGILNDLPSSYQFLTVISCSVCPLLILSLL